MNAGSGLLKLLPASHPQSSQKADKAIENINLLKAAWRYFANVAVILFKNEDLRI
jgi:hypothetical protein